MTPLIRQIWTMSAVMLHMIGQGLMLSYPVSLLPALNRPDSDIKVDLHSSSWLGSILAVSGIIGFLMPSVLMDRYGRKITHGVLTLPGIFGWLLIYFANSVLMLMVGRFLCGITGTAAVSLGAIVIGEYTSPKYRGVFLYLKNLTTCLGVMFMHLASGYFHWRTNALVSAIPLFIALPIICMWPESPAWLASVHQIKTCEESFYWLRGKDEASQRELHEILKVEKDKLSKSKTDTSYYDKILNFLRKFTQKDFLKPFFVMVLTTIVMEMSGRHIFPSYALQIISAITGETSQSFYYTLGIDVIVTISAGFASVLVKIMKRRTLLFSTGFAAVVILLTECLYLFLASKNTISKEQIWLPGSILILYFVLANLGCSPIPLVLLGEVFPLAHRGVGSALSGLWIAACAMISLKSTPYLLVSLEVYGLFVVCGSIMGIALLILYFIMPETKDRTLQEIEYYFNYGNFEKDGDDDEEACTEMIKHE